MSVTIKVYAILDKYTDGERVIEVDGTTVGQCLARLTQKYPALREALFDKNGELLDYIKVYVNGKRPYPELLDKPVKERDNILLTMPMGGG